MKKENSGYKQIFTIGAWTCLVLIIYSLITMLLLVFLGGPPETIGETYQLLQTNKFETLLRLDILTVFVMPVYYLMYFSIFVALKQTNFGLTSMATLLIFVGLTLFLASPSVFSFLHLSDKFALAQSEVEKNMLLAAGEAILSVDIWHGTGAVLGGLITHIGIVLVCVVMLQSDVFSKLTAYTGLFVHGLDLVHIAIGFFLPTASFILMAIAGPFYLLWFPLVGWRLFKLAKT